MFIYPSIFIVKILHATAWYPPGHIGGTEIYVAGLARELNALDVGTAVITPCNGSSVNERWHEGIRVLEYPSQPDDHAGLDGLRRCLEAEKPDVFHLHTWTPACGLDHLRLARQLGLRTVWTLHVPAPVCLRGTHLFRGTSPCDGRITPLRCGACWAQSRGLPWPLASLAMALPELLTALGGLQAGAHARRVKQQLEEAVALSDRIICVSRFLREALLANGVSAYKLVLSRQGVSTFPFSPRKRGRDEDEPLRVGFIGRWDAVKGLHVLVEAFLRLPTHAPLTLDIHVRSTDPVTDYERELRTQMSQDKRVRLFVDTPRDDTLRALADFDALAVPSQCLETGPLSVLEAAQAGVPVLGSDIGGIAEWLESGILGWPVRFNDANAWREALQDLPSRLASRSHTHAPVRGMLDVARDMAQTYREILAATPV